MQIPVLAGAFDRPAFARTQLCLLVIAAVVSVLYDINHQLDFIYIDSAKVTEGEGINEYC